MEVLDENTYEAFLVVLIFVIPVMYFMSYKKRRKLGKKLILEFDRELREHLNINADIDYLIGYKKGFTRAKMRVLVFEENVMKLYSFENNTSKEKYFDFELKHVYQLSDKELSFQYIENDKRLRAWHDEEHICDILASNDFLHTKNIYTLPQLEKYKKIVKKLKELNKVSSKVASR